MPRGRGLRRRWTEPELEQLRALYPEHTAERIAAVIGRSVGTVRAMASKLGLKKSAEWLATPGHGRISRGERRGTRTEFQRGHTTWNKGQRYVAGGRSAQTRFQAGHLPWRTLPIGSYRLTKDGYLQRKYAERPGGPSQRWRSVHRLVWEAEHGPTPPGHVVVFLPGMRTNVLEEITLDRLELIHRSEVMRRNSVHQLPPELAEVVLLRGALVRRINQREKRAKKEKQPA